MKNNYVYLYTDPSNGEPIYVGMGHGDRAYFHLTRSDKHHLTHRIQKMKREGVEPVVTFIASDLTRKEAFKVEVDHITKYGRRDLGTGSLLNLTAGGPGVLGVHFTEELRKSMVERRSKRKPMSEEAKAHLSKLKTGRTLTEETKAKMRKPKSEETKAKMAAARRARV